MEANEKEVNEVLNKAWNPHGWIAVPLETIAKSILGNEVDNINNTFLSADNIESGTFVEVMFFLLRKKYGLEETYTDFAKKCQPLFGKAISKTDEELASSLMDEFRTLIVAKTEC